MTKDTRELTSLEDIFNDIFLNGFSDLHFELVQEHINQAKAEAEREARIDELKNWRARTLLTANDPLNIRVEMEARIKELSTNKKGGER